MTSPRPIVRFGNLSFIRFTRQGWDGWVLESWDGWEPFLDLDAWIARTADEDTVLDVPCRLITRSRTSRGTVYAKLMRAQNDGVLKKNERFSKFKWCCYPSRARRVVMNTAQMIALGNPCPTPILGLRRRKGLFRLPEDLLVTAELADPTVEARLLTTQNASETREILTLCGKKLAKLHADGFIHGDFLPRNTCLSADNTCFSFLDNDRTLRRPPVPFFHPLRRNLTQFCFNLWLLARTNDRERPDTVIRAYGEAAGWSPARLQSEIRRIHTANMRRWNKTAAAELKRSARQTAAL